MGAFAQRCAGGGDLLHQRAVLLVDRLQVADRAAQLLQVNAAYRAGDWTPYASWSRSRTEADTTALGLLPVPPAHPLYQTVAGLLASQEGDKEFSAVGVRYDVNTNIAVKVDYTHYKSTILDGSDADLVAAGVVFIY